MAKSYEMGSSAVRDVQMDIRSDRGAGSGYGGKLGDLARGYGVDLNYGANAIETERAEQNNSTGEDLNRYSRDARVERLDSILDNFQEDNWSDLSLEQKKQSMTDLANYVAADTGNDDPPKIVFRDDMADGSYGGYSPDSNTMEINVNMLDDSIEAADTVAHEMWHAHQHRCAMDPASEKGQDYQDGFDNYISPDYDFEGYQNQMVEAEAREYAQGFKDKLSA
jgi:hypothetical protein